MDSRMRNIVVLSSCNNNTPLHPPRLGALCHPTNLFRTRILRKGKMKGQQMMSKTWGWKTTGENKERILS
ncbi:hypothetical protein PAXRUDRAFT_821004 [Paxillus rubicundulus Ve08.2h10]|uniref:Uncharacterized protein n=1 Tax=Paxillus rubicundulus Ve08.2h10 TaxID=930991 RepID=A0A0D0EB74_9AGAM|nr:hypothetical protein PAXRUDRAFT_821004 [Paxillus rubicundulus Ve08.2h10]